MIRVHLHDYRGENTSMEQLCAKKIVIIIKRYCYSNDHNKPDANQHTAHNVEISFVNHLTFICTKLLFFCLIVVQTVFNKLYVEICDCHISGIQLKICIYEKLSISNSWYHLLVQINKCK